MATTHFVVCILMIGIVAINISCGETITLGCADTIDHAVTYTECGHSFDTKLHLQDTEPSHIQSEFANGINEDDAFNGDKKASDVIYEGSNHFAYITNRIKMYSVHRDAAISMSAVIDEYQMKLSNVLRDHFTLVFVHKSTV